ncbi:ecdysone 20-monooxygenase [Culicoides brevitarsis]|uniref:ecdysone 20-monooxygenase n=1 Tax=Culicoides brevitarsis TaxID=469753 RepID=UPI00307C2781
MWTVSYVLYAIIVGLFAVSYRKSKGVFFLKDVITKLNVILKSRDKKKFSNLNNNNNESDKTSIVRSSKDIPGPLSVPLFGTKWIYWWRYKMTKIHETYKDFYKKYGPIVVEKTGNGFPIVSLFDRDDIERVLRYPSKYPFRPPTEIIGFYRKSRPDRYASVGMPNAQGEEWYHLRSKLTGGITSRKLLWSFLPTLNVICDDFIDLIKHKRDENGVVHNFQDMANLMGLETVCCLMLGRRVGYLSKDTINPRFNELASAVKRLFILQRDAYFGNGMWKHFPTKTYKDFAQTEDLIYDIVSEIVDETLQNGDMECQTEDIRSVYLNILNSDVDIRDKKAGIIDFIAAGIETLAHTLSFFFYFITQDPHDQERIYHEFAHCHGEITVEMLSKAHYTKACIHENYRLCPTAFCIARILEEDYTLSGYHLKAGSFVLCQTMVACQDEKNFKDAKKFLPQRWLDPNQNEFSINAGGPGASIVLPFGIGKRTCPGKKYIEMELSLVVAKLLKEFKVEFIGELETAFEFLIAPKTPVNVRFVDRTL